MKPSISFFRLILLLIAGFLLLSLIACRGVVVIERTPAVQLLSTESPIPAVPSAAATPSHASTATPSSVPSTVAPLPTGDVTDVLVTTPNGSTTLVKDACFYLGPLSGTICGVGVEKQDGVLIRFAWKDVDHVDRLESGQIRVYARGGAVYEGAIYCHQMYCHLSGKDENGFDVELGVSAIKSITPVLDSPLPSSPGGDFQTPVARGWAAATETWAQRCTEARDQEALASILKQLGQPAMAAGRVGSFSETQDGQRCISGITINEYSLGLNSGAGDQVSADLGVITNQLLKLRNLRQLTISDLHLTGAIPPELGDLTALQELRLSTRAHLTGTIPPELSKLSDLRILQLSDTQLTGSIPPELGSLAHLEVLDLIGNQLTGPIPPELGNLNELQRLELGFNRLSGVIPKSLGNLTNLKQLSLGNNDLTGPVPPGLGKLVNLTELTLWENQLSGSIPPELGDLTELTFLSLEANKLTGSVPPQLGNLGKLTQLRLHGNLLSGALPPELSRLSHVWRLTVNDNHLNGTVSVEFRKLTSLQDFGIERNDGLCLPAELQNENWARPDTGCNQ